MCANKAERTWKTGSATHEGLPLLLRVPAGLDYDAFQKRFPTLLVVRHELSRIGPLGLPEPDYNESLFDLDNLLTTTLEARDEGVTVLVETFGGKRIYYAYVADHVEIDERERLTASRFPSEKLTWDLRDDPDWEFIRSYAREYGF